MSPDELPNFPLHSFTMIGIFDSGIGGLTVARAVEQLLPEQSLLYLGDIARTPYGSKSTETIVQYSLENTRFLIENGAKIIVIGCNSASSVAAETLRKNFDIPIFEVITPAVEETVSVSRNGRVGIIGTRATISSNSYSNAIAQSRPECKVFTKACPLLVPLVEEGWITKKETKMILKKYLYSLKNQQIDTLILGCTHYPMLKHLIQPRIGKRVTLIDSSVEVAKYIKRFLEKQPNLLTTKKNPQVRHRYVVTDLTETTEHIAAQIFKRPIQLQLV